MEQIKLDIVPAGVASVAHASQFDNGRQIRFNLFNQGTPYTLTGAETVTMVVNGEEENITNTSDNYVIWDVAEEDCEEVGVIGCEIRIVLGSMLIGSKNFFLEVEMDPYDGKNVHVVTVGPADICTFETTLAEPLQVTVDVEATGGNGTPDSPTPIVGYTEANITANGETVTISFGQTVYGGQLDVTSGKVTLTHRIINLWDFNFSYNSSDATPHFTSNSAISDSKNPSSYGAIANILCSQYDNSKSWSSAFGSAGNNGYIALTPSGLFGISDDRYTSPSDFKTALQTENAKLVYELATPIEIDTTPEVISAVVGTNNVFADCGQTTVKYLKVE